MSVQSLQELKTVVGSNKIQVIFTPASPFAAQQMKIMVNDVQRTLDSNQQVVVEESGKQSAIVQCDKIRCEILSEQYGVFVTIDSERVQVEVRHILNIITLKLFPTKFILQSGFIGTQT